MIFVVHDRVARLESAPAITVSWMFSSLPSRISTDFPWLSYDANEVGILPGAVFDLFPGEGGVASGGETVDLESTRAVGRRALVEIGSVTIGGAGTIATVTFESGSCLAFTTVPVNPPAFAPMTISSVSRGEPEM